MAVHSRLLDSSNQLVSKHGRLHLLRRGNRKLLEKGTGGLCSIRKFFQESPPSRKKLHRRVQGRPSRWHHVLLLDVYQITSANSRERQTSDSDGSNFLIVGFPDPLLQRYRACVLASSFGLSEIYQQLDITSVSNFVIDHLQYSCDSRDARTSTNQFEVLWPFRFVALTRLDSPLREILLRCGKQLYPPAPFWEDFGKWSDCSATCGGGSQTRKRMCKDGANPRVISNGCIGEGIEKRSCNTIPCPGNHEWGEWSDWKTCTSVFQCYGQQTRTRICLQEIETIASTLCNGSSIETRFCSPEHCPQIP
ncbi:uncharacterized protein LOC143446411 isoform X2 [Clavelina lepadiformis]|uniref:uncharacterized protein LOC143446411 isoform X2 n=1 Tax=Clavelina lepadiformis TaxID=159417 RepID=UPI004040FB4B